MYSITHPQRSTMTSISPRRRLLGGAVGTFVEWYDFLIYGLSAPVLAVHFFPEASAAAGIVSTFAIYAVAFLARPIGGVYFGRIGDRLGRIKTLGLIVLLMGGATTLLGLLPTFATIGILAPLLLLLCRVVQGFSAGGETSGATAYIIESAPSDRRAFWVSFCVAGSWAPIVIASGVIFGLRAGLGDEAYMSWGWRIPFLLGGLLAVVGLWLRRRLDDPEEFVEASRAPRDPHLLRTALTRHWRAIVTVMLLVAVQGVGAYLLLSYMYSYLVTVAGMTPTSALLANSLGVASMAVLILPAGRLSDRVGRRRVMFAGAVWLAVASWPAMTLASSGGFGSAVGGQLLIAVGVALFSAGGFVTMAELFSTSMRFTGHAIGYNVGYAIFGGTTPLIAAALVAITGSAVAPAFYVILIAALGVVVVGLIPETKGVRLRDAGEASHPDADNVSSTASPSAGPEPMVGRADTRSV
ncbi:putative major facilitator superfamily transporter [Gordonia polyisoprenivorans VH2]|uniref:Putative proline/betaine transporter n=2 Tax=Gordonia polyisoprenivorans TaxID=84595 RepID=H6MZ62_GORPV|nr:putative major facilitator superfamily transporter [Gordonia polyisoprenivorans VH2]